MKIENCKIENSPKAVLHIDGDSFFTSCETSVNPRLKGLPVVTGHERGIASAMSKEAKALGVSRGMPVFKIRELFPQVLVLHSDYSLYEMFARRMFAIVGRYASVVEEYSIDECFALLREPNLETVSKIKQDLQSELGMTFSLGLAPTKVLAKLASSSNKPDGLTILRPEGVCEYLRDVDVGKIWGIGPSTADKLRRMGVKTAEDLRSKSAEWGREHLDKHTLAIWHELNGKQVFPLERVRQDAKSIQATRTFKPPTADPKVLLSELSKHVENACAKMRRQKMSARKIYFFLKTQEYRYLRHEITPPQPVSSPAEIVGLVGEAFKRIDLADKVYRATGVTLSGLLPVQFVQEDLFSGSSANDKWRDVLKVVDKLDQRYGSHTVTLASSLEAYQRLGGPNSRRLNMPFITGID